MNRLQTKSAWIPRDLTLTADRIVANARNGRLRRTFGAMAAFAALASGWEAYAQHLRGAFNDWLMWTPIALTPPMVLAGLGSIVSARVARFVLPWLSFLVLVDGVIGFVFHVRGVGRLPGGFRFSVYNITMGPPIFAPMFLCAVGFIGLLAAMLRWERWG